jgi:ribosomal-protein-alanine N-acetyltransferase
MKVSIVETTLPALAAEDRSAAELCALLGIAEPAEWPPLYNDADTRAWFRRRLEADPAARGWMAYYVVAEIEGRPTLAGAAGFKGPPDAEGTVEIGYSIVAPYHRQGIATAAVELLLEKAFADSRVARVTAETPVSFAASRGLLEKCGFIHVGERSDPEDGDLVIYAIARSAA